MKIFKKEHYDKLFSGAPAETSSKNADHEHEWKSYDGLVETFEYCDCGTQKKDAK